MTDEYRDKAQDLIHKLQDQGRHDEGRHLQQALSERVGDALLLALREACQTILTAVEAIDPVMEMEIEELRLKIDQRLTPDHATASPGTKSGA